MSGRCSSTTATAWRRRWCRRCSSAPAAPAGRRGAGPAARLGLQQPAEPARSAAAAAFFNAAWRHLLLRTFDELPEDRWPDGDDRWWEVGAAAAAPSRARPWWDDRSTPAVETRDDMLAARDDRRGRRADRSGSATTRPTGAGATCTRWSWSTPRSASPASAPVEWLFNRGPKGTSGGGAIVNATGWSADVGYQVDAVPSMRMIVDMSNMDASRWVQLDRQLGPRIPPQLRRPVRAVAHRGQPPDAVGPGHHRGRGQAHPDPNSLGISQRREMDSVYTRRAKIDGAARRCS